MNQTDRSARSESASSAENAQISTERGRKYIAKAVPHLRRGVNSGAVTAIIGGMGFLGGLRALRGGERRRGLAGLAFGAALLATSLDQRRSHSRGGESDVEETDVVDTGPDVETVADEVGGVGAEDHADGEAAAEVADTSPDVADVTTEETPTTEEDADSGVQTEEIDRLGEAAFDRQSREVPVPQRAFNQGFLAHSAEAFWGIRTSDDAVLVSQNYDAIQDRDEVRFVASSEIGDDVRELPIPNAVLNHWDEIGGGGTAVVGGDDILFVTTDDLTADSLLRVLPSKWDDSPGE